MNSVITRALKLTIGGTERDLPIRIFWPIDDTNAWSCRWEIDWPDRQRAGSAFGADAVQALLVALQMIGTELYCSDEHRSGRLSGPPDWSGYGFPLPGNLRDMLIGDDARFF